MTPPGGSTIDGDLSSELARLHRFWTDRYRDCSLSESGWLGAGDAHNALVYRCKRQALRRALRACGVGRTTHFSVLDAGCGQGFFADVYEREYPAATYTGIDLAAAALGPLGARHPRFHFHAADISSWRSAIGEKFDVVQSFEVLHLFLDDGLVERTLRNLAGQLASGGVMLVTAVVPHHTMMPTEYVRHLGRTEFLQLVHRAGLRLERVQPMYFWLPDGGPSNRYLRFAASRLGPQFLYVADRLALAARLPRIFQAGSDSAMKLLTLRP
jgi:SAM-dependent methyltransferase